ncbi:hypothetical protein J3E72DRAFT_242011 [Bipolaris maydis]|nr:hypothetical protein J3E74DRAFT_270362 [Bipolaris maydis]KAJ6198558.1 hypothetical protein J3E72DRAFT_242011 [Bipolaris maydis]KAJ6282134.1 hypothetical protein J3E71DRAFT_353449 [Bipolaris maydis]
MDPIVIYYITRRLVLHLARLTWWPVAKLITLALILLRPFYLLVSFALLPFVHLAHAIFQVVSLPFTVKWLEQIETLYVFLGIAALIGCITGTTLFIVFSFLSSSLRIDAPSVPDKPIETRTAAQYRAERRAKKEEAVHHLPAIPPVVLKKPAGPRRRGLLSQAIIEEEDSDF